MTPRTILNWAFCFGALSLIGGCCSTTPRESDSPSSRIRESAPEMMSPDLSAYDEMPQVIRRVRPEYPSLARAAEIEGEVWLSVDIDQHGKPRHIEVVETTAQIFNQPAIVCVAQWFFKPAMRNREPIPMTVVLPIRFLLEDP